MSTTPYEILVELRRVLPGVGSARREKAVSQSPRLDVNVDERIREWQCNAKNTYILRQLPPPEQLEYPRRSTVAPRASVASHGPLDPHKGDPQEEQRKQVRDHECATAVRRGLHREAQEIAEPHGVPSHG